MLYGIIGFILLYGFELCETSEGLCILLSPLVFHESLVEIITKNLAKPSYLFFLNTIIFAFEGAATEMLVRKVK